LSDKASSPDEHLHPWGTWPAAVSIQRENGQRLAVILVFRLGRDVCRTDLEREKLSTVALRPKSAQATAMRDRIVLNGDRECNSRKLGNCTITALRLCKRVSRSVHYFRLPDNFALGVSSAFKSPSAY
jgi:hypothetical protein